MIKPLKKIYLPFITLILSGLLNLGWVNSNHNICYALEIPSAASSKILLDYTHETITKNYEDVMTEHEIIKIMNKKGIKKYSSLTFPFSKKTRNSKYILLK